MWRVIHNASKLGTKVIKAIITTIPSTAPEKATRGDSVPREDPGVAPDDWTHRKTNEQRHG